MQIVIEGNPKGKGRPRAVRMGTFVRIYTDNETAKYEKLVADTFIKSGQKPFFNNEMLKADILIYHKIPKSTTKKNRALIESGKLRPIISPDIDNVVKCIFDGLNNVAFTDDKQILEVSAKRFYSDEPRVEVTIEAL